MFKGIAGLLLVAVLVTLMIPAGQAQAQCGCSAVCGAGLAAFKTCLDANNGSMRECTGVYSSNLSSCLGCVDSCPASDCYAGCMSIGAYNCEDGDGYCIYDFFAGKMSCLYGCDGCTALPFADGRLDQFGYAQPVAIYCTANGIEVWDIDAAGNGTLLFTAPADGEVPASNQTLMSSGDVLLSRLSTGEFQVNALDAEGNPYVLVWDGCPANEVYVVK